MCSTISIESACPILTFVLSGFKSYLSLPRPAFRASKSLAETPNPETGLYNLTHFSTEQWYTKSNWWTTHGPRVQMIRVLGGNLPESVLGKFKPQGYDLMIIGPQPQEGWAWIRWLQ